MPAAEWTRPGAAACDDPRAMRITERNLLTLAVGEYRDDQLPGFVVRITATKRHFEIRYTYQGRQSRCVIGNATLMPISEAREHARQLLASVKRGEDPRAITRGRSGFTISKLGAQFFAWAESTAAFKSLAERRRIWAQRIEDDLGGLDVSHLTRPRIREWGEGHARVSGVGANRAFQLLRAVYRWGIRRDVVNATPFYLLDPPFMGEVSRTRYLSRDELAALLAALNDLPFGLSRMIRLLLLTGVRKANVSLARWSEIDGDLWRIPAAMMKSGRAHDVPLSKQARAILDAQRECLDDTAAMVFPAAGGRDRSKASVSRVFLRRLRQHMSIHLGRTPEPWTLHDLRRTLATHAEDALGIRRDVIGAILSHASGSKQTRIYALGELFAERRDALQRWADYLDSLAPARAEQLVDQRAAARLKGVAVATLEQYRSGRFKRLGPPFVKIGQSVFYRVGDLEQWTRAHVLAQALPRDPNAPRRIHRKRA